MLEEEELFYPMTYLLVSQSPSVEDFTSQSNGSAQIWLEDSNEAHFVGWAENEGLDQEGLIGGTEVNTND